MMRKTLFVASVLALAACGSADPAPEQPTSREASASSELSKRLEEAKVLVDANGLGWKNTEGALHLGFGSPREEVDKALALAFDAEAEQSSNAECGAGPMDFTEIGPLQIAFQDSKFVGWYLSGDGTVVTSDGVKPGMALAQLKEWRPVRVITDSTLEGEFEYHTRDGGMITGFFEGSQSDGKIVALQAGLNCFFR